MSEESSASKSEEPTEKKKRDSREKGQTAQNKDLTAFVAILTIVSYFIIARVSLMQQIMSNYYYVLQVISNNQLTLVDLGQALGTLSTNALLVILPPIVLAAILSLVMNAMQIGGLMISKEAFKIDFNRLNPVANAKQTFAPKNLMKFLINIIQITIMSIVGNMIVKSYIPELFLMIYYSLSQLGWFMFIIIMKLIFSLLVIYFLFAVVVLWMEKHSMHKQLMMTKEEVKKEYKESEGDPEIKYKRKEMHREILESDDMGMSFDNASFVLANPTHIAIVMLYSPKRWGLPIVMLKASGHIAQNIFQAAKKVGIPIIQDKWLARKLYDIAEVGKFVPPSLTQHVAKIISVNIKLMPQVLVEMAAKSKQHSEATKGVAKV